MSSFNPVVYAHEQEIVSKPATAGEMIRQQWEQIQKRSEQPIVLMTPVTATKSMKRSLVPATTQSPQKRVQTRYR